MNGNSQYNNGSSSNEMLDDFDLGAPVEPLDRIVMLVEDCQKSDLIHRFIFYFLIPGALVIYCRIKAIFHSYPKISSFQRLIVQEPLLIGICTVSYIVMWFYLFPTVNALWQLFQNHNFDAFFKFLGQWQIVQAVIITTIHICLANFAIASFKLTYTFRQRHNLLNEHADAENGRHIIIQKTRNNIIEMVPQMMQSLINQSITALVASGDLSPRNAQQVTGIMTHIAQNLFVNSGYLSNTTNTLESQLQITEEYGDNDNFLPKS